MKRVFIALLTFAVLLLLPSSYLIAGSPASFDRPSIITPNDRAVTPPGPELIGNPDPEGDNNGGDADDLAGARGKWGSFSSPFDPDRGVDTRMAVKIWWMYFIIHRIL